MAHSIYFASHRKKRLSAEIEITAINVSGLAEEKSIELPEGYSGPTIEETATISPPADTPHLKTSENAEEETHSNAENPLADQTEVMQLDFRKEVNETVCDTETLIK